MKKDGGGKRARVSGERGESEGVWSARYSRRIHSNRAMAHEAIWDSHPKSKSAESRRWYVDTTELMCGLRVPTGEDWWARREGLCVEVYGCWVAMRPGGVRGDE